MHIKLTLTVDDKIIDRAKQYARNHKLSVSQMVESYFRRVTQPTAIEKASLPPITRSLKGSLKIRSNKPYKKLLTDALENRYETKSVS